MKTSASPINPNGVSVAVSKNLPKFPPVSLETNNQSLSDTDLLEIKDSLHHLGKAIYLFNLQQKGGRL
jgi:hypothetical protein